MKIQHSGGTGTSSCLVHKMMNLTNRFHFAVRLFSYRSQMTSKCGKNREVAHEAEPSGSLMFLPYFAIHQHSWIFRGVGKLFDNTTFKQLLIVFFPGRLLACLAELNASHCDWYSAVSFSLKSSTKSEYFSLCFGPEFWKSLPDDWLLWTLITRAGHATQWRHSCICPLIDNRHRPITARVESQLLYNTK